ncbi:MAG TPA: TonB-dependent receptor [Burkholderiaceae bacterium]|nr:TonB-dependent receptor [Burkholderiaceae bacterium]
MQEVEIVGIRASTDAAATLKKLRDEVSDSIVADDIDKLPDASVAEALQRVAGVQIARDRGEGATVVVRGLSQVETTVDGREVFSAGTGRTLDFASMASALVAGVDVYKTPSAERIEGGMAGQVDLRTRRPFDLQHDALEITARAVRAPLARDTAIQFSGLASTRLRLGGGELGLLAAVAVEPRPWREDQKSVGTPTGRSDLVPGTTVVAPGGTSETTSIGRRSRDTAQLAVQWRPTAEWNLLLQASDTRLTTKQDSYQINVGASKTFDPASVLLFPGTTDVERVTWTNAPISVLSFARDTTERTRQVAAGGQWKRGATVVSGDLSRTTSESSLFFSGPFFGGTAARFTQDLSTGVPSSAVEGTDLLSPGTYAYTGVAYRVQPFGGDLNAARLDLDQAVDLPGVGSIAAGVRWAARSASDEDGLVFGDVALSGPSVAALPGRVEPNPYANFLPGSSAPSLREFLVGNLADARDPAALRSAFGITAPLPTQGSPLGRWRIDERTASGYLKAGIDAFEGRLSGNAGLRLSQTRESVDGNASAPPSTTAVPVSQASRYTDLLPSLNLRYAFTPDQLLRLGASRTLTRPNFDQLSPSLTLVPNSVTPSLNQGSAGNPALRPIRSSGLDLAFETYGAATASIALFYRHVDGFVTTVSAPETWGGVTYQVSRPHNSLPADIHGFELSYQQFYTALPGWLGGLGLQANATLVSSRTPNAAVGGNVPLSNLSRTSANVVGLYDRGPLALRVAWNWRDRYLSGVTQVVGVGALPNHVQGYGWLDASLAWRIDAHTTLRLEGGNLLDTVRHSNWGSATRPQSVWQNGRQFGIALAMKV